MKTAIQLFVLLFVGMPSTLCSARPLVYELLLGETRVKIIGVAHVSFEAPDRSVSFLSNVLSHARFVAIESSQVRSRDYPVASSYLNRHGVLTRLPRPAERCVAREAADGLLSGWRRSASDNVRLWQLYLDLLDSPKLAPRVAVYPGVEGIATEMAKAAKLLVTDLETDAESYLYDRRQPDRELLRHIDSLCKALNDQTTLQKYRMAQERSILAAQRGDAELVRRLLFSANREILGLTRPDFHHVDARNNHMATAIVDLAKKHGSGVVFVGLLHLSGTSSIQSILRREGYNVNRTSE